jgi:hypothetical protein
VGVVPDLLTASNERDITGARIYHAALPNETGVLYIALHVRADPQSFTPKLRELANAIDPGLRVIDPSPLPRVLEEEAEFIALGYHLLTGLSSVALLLSLAGVYAVTAFAVAKRTREIGVRVALGARPRQIIFTVFRRPFTQIAFGIGVGAIIAGTLVIAESTSPLQELGGAGLPVLAISACCSLACIVPTRRALRIEPTEALKDEG